jgi:hypothetical protein
MIDIRAMRSVDVMLLMGISGYSSTNVVVEVCIHVDIPSSDYGYFLMGPFTVQLTNDASDYITRKGCV